MGWGFVALVGIWPERESDKPLAEKLGQNLSLPILSADESKLSLVVSNENIFLRLNSDKTSSCFQPDFSSSKAQRKIKDEIQRRGLLLKAIEGRSKETLKVFDFYSGFAMDAFVLACAGHQVISCEKNPLISLVTKIAWRIQKEEDWILKTKPQLTLKHAESKEFLRNSSYEFDVIYMDPMFEKPKSSSKSPLPMQIVQALLEDEERLDFKSDFEAASSYAKKIVVKLPLKGRPLLERDPSHQLLGKTIRYDVFVF